MPDIRIHSYSIDLADQDEFAQRRATLIAAMRDQHPGLIETRLIRLDDTRFIDSWRWASAEQMQAAFAAAGDFPEIKAAMSLTRDRSHEDGDVVDDS